MLGRRSNDHPGGCLSPHADIMVTNLTPSPFRVYSHPGPAQAQWYGQNGDAAATTPGPTSTI